MALSNISLVTATLKNLIEKYLYSKWYTSAPKPVVLCKPPDQLDGERIVGIYLYHITENGHFKNYEMPPESASPVRLTPMGLDLYYILTAHCKIGQETSDDSQSEEQLLMGLSVKALRDYPVIDDNTTLHGQDPAEPTNLILHDDLRGNNNKLTIELLNLEHTKGMPYWNSSNAPLRLSAYYRVSVVFLEPEQAPRRVGRVLNYGTHVFPLGEPHLSGSSNLFSFTLGAGAFPRTVKLEPAQVPVGDTQEENCRVELKGWNLGGTKSEFYIQQGEWPKPIRIDPFHPAADYSAWKLAITDEEIKFTAQPAIDDGRGTYREMLPGIYKAFIKKAHPVAFSGGLTRSIKHLSNSVMFTVIPFVKKVGALPSAHPERELEAEAEALKHVDKADVTVVISDEILIQKASGSPAKGQYVIKKTEGKITLKLSDGLIAFWNGLSEKALPFRLIINGAESQPAWIVPL